VGKLDGKTALITGAASGMGRATAVLFAREGAKVAIVDYTPTGGQETSTMVKELGGEAIFIEADVSKSSDVKRMVEKTLETYGRIDILYNNAGVAAGRVPTAEVTEEQWDRILNINLKGTFLGSKYTIPVMLDHGGGVIINTASVVGQHALAGMSPYCASKAGIILLTKTMALEYARRNIRVNCICPGPIQTPMTEQMIPTDPKVREAFMLAQSPMGKMEGPEEIAKAALYLASDDSSFVTGAALVVDGGLIAGMQSSRSRKR